MIQQVRVASDHDAELATRLHFSPGMSRFTTATRRARATVALFTATLASYAKIVGIVISERLWRMPPRRRRSANRSVP
jgi:hypothetical protein